MSKPKIRCGVCREEGHHRGECKVLEAGKKAVADRQRAEQQQKDVRFHLEGLRRAAKEILIAKYGKEEFERMAKEREELMDSLMNSGIGVAAISEENMVQFIKEFEKRGANSEEAFNAAIAAVDGVRVDKPSDPAESIDDYWARRRRDKQKQDVGLN